MRSLLCFNRWTGIAFPSIACSAEVEISWYVLCFELQDALVIGWPLVLTVHRASADATRGAVH